MFLVRKISKHFSFKHSCSNCTFVYAGRLPYYVSNILVGSIGKSDFALWYLVCFVGVEYRQRTFPSAFEKPSIFTYWIIKFSRVF